MLTRLRYQFLGSQTPEEERVSDIFENPENYTIGKVLGKGAFGTVYLATDTAGKKYAIKVIPLKEATRPKVYKSILKEAIITRGLELKHTVKTYGMFPLDIKGQSYIGLVQEYFIGKKLELFQAHARDNLSERELLVLMLQTMVAIEELHVNKIVHMDIKGDNIIVSGKYVKLIDLGLACRLDNSEIARLDLCRDVRGAIFFIPPEIYAGKYDNLYAADIWNFGVMFYELIYGELPFNPKADTAREAEAKIILLQKQGARYPIIPKFKPCIDVVKYCLNYDYKQRPSSNEVIQYINKQFLVES